MGKRELVLVLAFVVLGATAYRLSAPPPKPGQRGFSFSRLWQEIRRDLASTTYQSTKTHLVPAPVSDLDIPSFRGQLSIIGENRADIVADLTVEASGVGETEATARARLVTTTAERIGETLRVGVTRPDPSEGRIATRLQLRIPKRLKVRLEVSGGPTDIRQVAAVSMRIPRGEVRVHDVAGLVEGEHARGDLEVGSAASVRLVTRRSEVRLDHIQGEVTLEASEGTVRGSGLGGDARIAGRRTEIDVDGTAGPLKVVNGDARVTVRNASEAVQIENARGLVSVELSRPASADLSTTAERLELLVPAAGFTVDAAATGGQIRVTGAQLDVRSTDGGARASGAIAGGGPKLTLRNEGGDIIVTVAPPRLPTPLGPL